MVLRRIDDLSRDDRHESETLAETFDEISRRCARQIEQSRKFPVDRRQEEATG